MFQHYVRVTMFFLILYIKKIRKTKSTRSAVTDTYIDLLAQKKIFKYKNQLLFFIIAKNTVDYLSLQIKKTRSKSVEPFGN